MTISSRNSAISIVLVVLASMLSVIPNRVQASVPGLINYQGILRNAAGTPLPGTHQMTVSMYRVPSGPDPAIWAESLIIDADSAGLFNVLLGSVTPLDTAIISGPELYFGIAVGTDPEFAPRTRFVTVPYAFRVATIDGASGGAIHGDLTIPPTLRYYSVHHTDFHVGSGAQVQGDATYFNQPSGIPQSFAPVHLPHGATITRVVFYFCWSGSLPVEIQRVSFSDQVGVEILGSALSPPQPGCDSVEVTTIVNPVVDNSNFRYAIRIGGETTKIRGAKIEYTIKSPLP